MNTRKFEGKIEGKIRSIKPDGIQPDLIREAAGVINNGGVVVFPTTCLYGLGADAFNVTAIERIFKVKGRSHNKPLPVLIGDERELERLVRHIPASARSIMNRFWPGSVTIVFDAKKTLPEKLIAGTGRIGVRQPAHMVAFALLKNLKCPIIGTSANISNSSGCSRISEMDSRIINDVDLVLDAGQLKGGMGSTVIDVTSDPPEILREGTVPVGDIFSVLQENQQSWKGLNIEHRMQEKTKRQNTKP